MLARFFVYLKHKIENIEVLLTANFANQNAGSSSKIFLFQTIKLNLALIILEIISDLIKFVIILFADSSQGFNVIFCQQAARTCPHSYHKYRSVRTRIRTFSIAGVASMVAVAVISSLVTNLIFGGKLPTWAATFNWAQESWAGGTSTEVAIHPGGQAGWNKYFSKDNDIVLAGSGEALELGQLTSILNQTTDSDFLGGSFENTRTVGTGNNANVSVAGGRIMAMANTGFFESDTLNLTQWSTNNYKGAPLTAQKNATFFLNEDIGWYAYYYGISKTVDGGRTWQEIFKTTSAQYHGVFFIDELNGVRFHNTGYAKTTDGGINWNSYTLPTNIKFYDAYLFDINNGFFVGNNSLTNATAIYKLVNTTLIEQPVPGIGKATDVEFDGDRGVAWGDFGILVTTDRGVTWQTALNLPANISSQPLSSDLNGAFIDENTGFFALSGWSKSIFKTVDGGHSFSIATTVPNNVTAVDFCDSQFGVAVDYDSNNRCNIYKTENGGVDWQVQANYTGFCFNPKKIKCVNQNLSYIITSNTFFNSVQEPSRLIKVTDSVVTQLTNPFVIPGTTNYSSFSVTSDGQDRHLWLGGTTGLYDIVNDSVWSQKSTANANSVNFVSSTTGLVGFVSSQLQITTDGGNTFSLAGVNRNIYDIKIAGNGQVWAVGANSSIYRSDDILSNQWTELSANAGSSFTNLRIYPFDNKTIVGGGGLLTFIDEQGNYTYNGYPKALSFSSSTASIVFSSGNLVQELDIATGSTTKTLLKSEATSVYSLKILNGSGWAVGSKTYRISNNLETWEEHANPSCVYAGTGISADLFPNGKAYCHNNTTANSSVFENGSWKPLFTQTNKGFFFSNEKGWSVGNGGIIRYTDDGGFTWQYGNSGTASNLKDLYFFDNLNGFIAGQGIFSTVDGGITFQPTSVVASINAIDFCSNELGYAITTNGKIYKYANNVWTDIKTLTGITTYDVACLENGRAVVVGYSAAGPNFYHTVNEGADWTSSQVGAVGSSLQSIDFFDQTNGFIVGFNGLTFQATSSIDSWQQIAGHSTTCYEALSYAPGSLIVGCTSGILKTYKSGGSWNSYTLGSDNVNSVFLPKNTQTSVDLRYTSSFLDFGGRRNFSDVTFSISTSTGNSIAFDVRGSNQVDGSDATDWLAVDYGSNIASLSGNRYLQYRVNYTVSDFSVPTSLNEISFGYVGYATDKNLISSIYNSLDPKNAIGGVTWNGEAPEGTSIKFQIRSASSSAEIGSLPWQGPDGTSGSYFENNDGSDIMPAVFLDTANDQFFQYKASFFSDGLNTPTLNSVSMYYVINVPPEAAVVSASQQNSGLVAVAYQVRDADTANGARPGEVSVNLDYCTANCANVGSETWVRASLASLSGSFGTTSVTDEMQDKTLYWNPKIDYNGIFNPQFKIRLSIDDFEAANSLARASSDSFSIDSKNPETSSVFGHVDASQVPAVIHFDATDDSLLSMRFGGQSDLSGVSWTDYSSSSTIDLGGNYTAYLQLKDEFNNSVDFTINIPEKPASTTIWGTVDQVSGRRVFTSWDRSSLHPSNFKQYNIWRSIDGINYALLATTANQSYNYYLDTQIEPTETYSYKITTEDNDGNISPFSAVISITPDAFSFSDVVAPILYGVEVGTTTTQTATIIWQTDELSNSTVGYGTAPDNLTQEVGVASMVNNDTGAGIHRVVISGLEPDTEYFFRVKSTDVYGNYGEVLENLPFATKPGPVISAVGIKETGNTSATIAWQANVPASSSVIFSTSSDFVNAVEVHGTGFGLENTVILTGLAEATRYYFYVKSVDAEDNEATDKKVIDGVEIFYDLTTLNDVVPPIISSLSCSPVSESELRISWTTNELAASQAFYGSTPAPYASSTESAIGYNISHSVNIQNLNASSTYYYLVTSSDVAGNVASSTEQACATTKKTILEEVANEQLNQLQGQYEQASSSLGQALSNYQNALASSTELANQLGQTSASTTELANQLKQAQDELALIRGQIEQAREQGRQEGRASSGGGGIITIDKTDKTVPVISNIEVTAITASSARVSWVTDELASGFVKYGADNNFGNYVGFENLFKEHYFVLKNLEPKTAYFYSVSSADSSGNLAKSETLTFTTADQFIETILETPVGDGTAIKEEVSEKMNLEVMNNMAEKMMGLMGQFSKVVSLNTLENQILSQFKALQEFADMIPAPVLSGEPSVKTTPTTATIRWTTDKKANSLVAYAPQGLYVASKGNNAYAQIIGQSYEQVNSHAVTIINLKPETVYHYQLQSKSDVGPLARSRDFTFKTKPDALEIVSFNSEILSPEKAQFNWLTSLEADTQITYTPYRAGKLSQDELKTISNKALSVNHEMVLNDLESGAVYQVELASTDKKGIKVSNTVNFFSTTKDDLPPVIDNIQTESALSQGKDLKVQTAISWTTNEPTACSLKYAKGSTQVETDLTEETMPEASYSRKHALVITKFELGSVYSFRIYCTDSGDNQTISEPHAILTPKQRDSVFDLIINTMEQTFGWIGKLKG